MCCELEDRRAAGGTETPSAVQGDLPPRGWFLSFGTSQVVAGGHHFCL